MRTSLAGRAGTAGLTRALLLALALGACGGGDGGDGGGSAADTTTDTSAAVQTAGAATCSGPPPAYTQSVLNGPWQALLDSLAADTVSFPEIPGNDTTATVKLCHKCAAVAVEIRSSNLTPCLSPDDLQGPGRRITGMFIVRDTFPAQHGWDALLPGDSLFLFTNSVNGPATLVYNQDGSGKPAPTTAWQFWYCTDGHAASNTPQAQWKPRGTPPVTGTNPGKGKGPGDDDGGGGSYGWMACASGCCQFYTPPPNEGEEETNGPSYGKPYWCPAT